MTPEDMEKLLRDNVSTAIGEHCEEKKKGGAGKKMIPKIYKRLFKKKKRISRRYNNLDLDLSIKERNDMKEKIRVIEQEIRREKQGKIDREEEEAWLKMKENQKTFYQYARKKKRVHPYIGPFCVKGVIIRKKACEVLADEFFNAFRAPTKEENDEIDDGYFSDDEDLTEGRTKLEKIVVTVDEVMEEMMNMSSEASGPSGINPYVTKKFGKALVPYLTLYYNRMIDYEEVPEINRFNYVAPLIKPGKPPEDPTSY